MSKVTIIGGGIIGLFTAYYLVEAGFEVTVLDQGRALCTGAPEEVRRDPAVLDAYLGGADEDEVEDAAEALR